MGLQACGITRDSKLLRVDEGRSILRGTVPPGAASGIGDRQERQLVDEIRRWELRNRRSADGLRERAIFVRVLGRT